MNAKIPGRFWTDEKLEELPPELKLAVLWLFTNDQVSLCGLVRVSLRRFTSETNLPADALGRALDALPTVFERMEKNGGITVWIRNYVRVQFGDGNALARNKIAKAIVASAESSGCPSLPLRMGREYPSLAALFMAAAEELPKASPSQGDAIQQSRAEQSRAEQSAGQTAEVLTETKRRICALFGRKPSLTPTSEAALFGLLRDDVLPLSEADWKALEIYQRTEPEDDFDPRRQSADGMAQNLLSELDKARRSSGGLTAEIGQKKITAAPAAEEWNAFCLRRGWSGDLTWTEAPEDVQREFFAEQGGAA